MPRSCGLRTVIPAAVAVVGLVACSGQDRSPETTPAPVALPVVGPPGTPLDKAGPYQVLEVLDATTLRLERGGAAGGPTVVRMLGVVAPEGRGERPRCFGVEALVETRRLLEREAVWIVGEPGVQPVDSEGRVLAYVWLDTGRMANDLLAEGGFGREVTGAPTYVYREVVARSEQLARHGERGLWATGTCGGNIARPA